MQPLRVLTSAPRWLRSPVRAWAAVSGAALSCLTLPSCSGGSALGDGVGAAATSGGRSGAGSSGMSAGGSSGNAGSVFGGSGNGAAGNTAGALGTGGGRLSSGGVGATGGMAGMTAGSGGGSGFASAGGRAAGGATTGGIAAGGATTGGAGRGGSSASGGANANRGGAAGASAGGMSSAGTSSGGASSGGASSGGASGGGASGGSSGDSTYPCDGKTTGYNALVIQSGSNWTVTNGGRDVYSGADLQQALTRAYASLTSGRTAKQSILVQGSGDLPASAQLSIPSYTVLNVCGTINVSGTASGSDRSPLYARNARDIEIPNLKMTGAPQYGVFFRQTNNIRLGHIELRLSSAAGIGIRVDSGPSASTQTTFNENLTIDYVYGSGMGSHIVETYGISNIKIGTVEGSEVGECGLLLNRSINAEIGLVSCNNCATGTGYAAFRVANSVGKVGSDFPAGNIHVGKVYARGGGRGIFSVSGSGGLTIDEIDIANTGNSPILLQNAYNTTIAAKSGTVSKGLVQLSNDTDNTNEGVYPPSKNVALQNLTLSNGASVRQDWCAQFGKNGCSATNITGGTVSMCE